MSKQQNMFCESNVMLKASSYCQTCKLLFKIEMIVRKQRKVHCYFRQTCKDSFVFQHNIKHTFLQFGMKDLQYCWDFGFLTCALNFLFMTCVSHHNQIFVPIARSVDVNYILPAM